MNNTKPFSSQVQQVIVKVASRCNINCTYCYMYNLEDSGWRKLPSRISTDTVVTLAEKLATHARIMGLQSIDFVLHGGEPLLLGADGLREFLEISKATLAKAKVGARFAVQTNGLLLTDKIARVLEEYQVSVGVSCDGIPGEGDSQRVDFSGNPTGRRLEERLRHFLRSHHHLFGGFITMMNLRQSPRATFDYLCSFDPPSIDFHLPLANHRSPPDREAASGDVEAYGKWYAELFDHIIERRPSTKVRLVTGMIEALLGYEYAPTTLGYRELGGMVVATDGSLELIDNLKSAYDGAACTGLNIHRNSIEEFTKFRDEWVARNAVLELSPTCSSCSLVKCCQGGFYVRRYASPGTFRNPDVYCKDLQFMIRHTWRKLRAAVDIEQPNTQMGALS